MQIENFKVFVDLVETKSFSKAAKINGMTQSAVSQQAKSLERGLKSLLIDRSQKQFGLTLEGQVLYAFSKEILSNYEQMQSQLEEMKTVVSGTVRISTIYSLGLHVLNPYLKQVLRDYPKVKCQVEYRRSNQVYDDVQQGVVDLGLVAFPTKSQNIEFLPFHNDRLVLITHPKHEFSKFSSIDVRALNGQKLITFDPDIPTRKAIDCFFREHKVDLASVIDFDNVEMVKRAVEIGNGIAIVPFASVQQEVRTGALSVITFKNHDFVRPLAIMIRKGRALTPAMKKVVEILQTDASKLETSIPHLALMTAG